MMNVSIQELLYSDSREYLHRFQLLENASYMDWFDCEDENASYIWLLEDVVDPIGFLSYKVLPLSNQKDFVYIVKIYVLQKYRGGDADLIEDEKASEILLRRIERKGVDILTLEPSCVALDRRYEELGFEYLEEISRKFGSIIGTGEKIMYKNITANTEDIKLG